MKKFVATMLLLLNVTNLAFADCVTGYACSIKDLNKNNTNSVMQNKPQNDPLENSKEKINTEQNKIRKQIDEKTKNEKEIQVEAKP